MNCTKHLQVASQVAYHAKVEARLKVVQNRMGGVMQDSSDRSSAKGLGVGRRELLRAIAGAGVATAGAFTPPSVTHAEVWEEGDEQCRVQEVEPSSLPDLTELQLKQFISVSETLTGIGKHPSQSPLVLQPRLAAQYLERFARLPDYFPKLLRLFDVHEAYAAAAGGAPPNPDKIAERIMNNQEADADDIRAAAEQVIYLWYVSAFFLPALTKAGRTGPPVWIYGSTEQYEQSLLWKVVKAHAPMMPGGKAKYWAVAAI